MRAKRAHVPEAVAIKRQTLRHDANKLLRSVSTDTQRRPAKPPINHTAIPSTIMAQAFVAALSRHGITIPSDRRAVVELILVLIRSK